MGCGLGFVWTLPFLHWHGIRAARRHFCVRCSLLFILRGFSSLAIRCMMIAEERWRLSHYCIFVPWAGDLQCRARPMTCGIGCGRCWPARRRPPEITRMLYKSTHGGIGIFGGTRSPMQGCVIFVVGRRRLHLFQFVIVVKRVGAPVPSFARMISVWTFVLVCSIVDVCDELKAGRYHSYTVPSLGVRGHPHAERSIQCTFVACCHPSANQGTCSRDPTCNVVHHLAGAKEQFSAAYRRMKTLRWPSWL